MATQEPAASTRADREKARLLALQRLRLAKWQADLAYFQARLALIGEPTTLHQAAQRRTFAELHQAIGTRRQRLSS